MKAIVTFVLLINFWLNATYNDSVSENPNQKKPAKRETADAEDPHMIRTDSVSGYSINVNGQLNSVQITNDAPAQKSLELEAEAKHKGKSNSIEINGAGNSVNINQNKNGGRVNIRQNGSGNQVNISQTNQHAIK